MAYGDIGAPQDTLEFDLTDISRPDMIHVAGDIYAIAYVDASGHGVLITVDISIAGSIQDTLVDTLTFEATACGFPTIVHVSGDIFAIAYSGVDADGWICTVDISAAGAMGAAVEDSWEFEAGVCYEPCLVHVSGSTFAIAYRSTGNDGITTTVSIAANGTIGGSVLDTETFITSNGNEPTIVHVAGSTFAIVYRTGAYKGWICTISISAGGIISTDPLDTLEFDAAFGSDPDICHVSGNIYAIAYRGTDDDGFVCTVIISDAGAMGAAVEDVLEFDAGKAAWPDIIHLAKGVCAIAYGGVGSDGWLTTVEVYASGQINNAILDTSEYDAINGVQPSIVRVSGDQYVIAYSGVENDGFLKTPTIETPPEGKNRHLMMMGVG